MKKKTFTTINETSGDTNSKMSIDSTQQAENEVFAWLEVRHVMFYFT